MINTEWRYLQYWGKAQPRDENQLEWHPAAYHGLDVAAVGDALLDFNPRLQNAIAQNSGLEEGVARRWFLFALALHDVGKFACSFQYKVPAHFYHAAQWTDAGPGADPGHGRTGLKLWEDGCSLSLREPHPFEQFFADADRAEDARLAFTPWIVAVAGHHGRPVIGDDILLRQIICSTALTDARSYIAACAALFDPRLDAQTRPPKEGAMKRSAWLIGGLAMLCDWIGSNQEWFPYTTPDYSAQAYWDKLRDEGRGRKALERAGFAAPIPASRFTIEDALGLTHATPTPLQCWASEVEISGQSLVVIEDLTGAGKTEAGLILAHRLMAYGAAEGLYWALPTMATADALYHRLAKSYQRLFTDNARASLMLAHSASAFNTVFTKSIFAPPDVDAGSYEVHADDNEKAEDQTASAICARWLADDRRKTFLADIGVGTIDQALLGVLPTKHQALRLAALSRRVLVIDEAHSFDPYMTKLTERLIEFQAALGGSVIVMSATLTLKARRQFAAAFAKGADDRAGVPVNDMAFPLATLIAPQRAPIECGLTPERGTRRDLPVRRLDDADAAIGVLKDAVGQGLGAVWIRNTVQDALDAYEKLKAVLPEVGIDLFHARFALGDRLDIEKRVLKSFGKNSAGTQRHRIVIATQVIEQSLDCDWDVMISDLAPIDLLIQRAGRLHRHDHHPPRPKPILHIVSPPPIPDAGAQWYENAFPLAAYVYRHHGQLWLTMKALLDSGGLNLSTQPPRDLIERVFAEGSNEMPTALADASCKAEGEEMSKRAAANLNGLELRRGYTQQAGAWESDTRTPTRLGDDNHTLRLARWDGARLAPWFADEDIKRAWRLSEVSVSMRRVSMIDYNHDPALERAVASEIGSWPERYDPPLLVALTDYGESWHAKGRAADGKPVELVYDKIRGLRFV